MNDIGDVGKTTVDFPPVEVAPEPTAKPISPRRWKVTEAVDGDLQSWETAAGAVVAYSARSPTKSSANEDALGVIEPRNEAVVLVVADGLGGQSSGEAASALAIESLLNAVDEAVRANPEAVLRTAILDGIDRANRAILDLGSGAATTLAVAEIEACFVRPYHVGDSSIVLMGQRGRVKFETIAHSPVGYAVESGLLPPGEALHHEDRHIVSNCLGSNEMRIEIGPTLSMACYDTLLLSTDGLTDNLLPGEAVEAFRAGPLGKAVSTTAAEVRSRMEAPRDALPSKPDDLTIVAFRRSR